MSSNVLKFKTPLRRFSLRRYAHELEVGNTYFYYIETSHYSLSFQAELLTVEEIPNSDMFYLTFSNKLFAAVERYFPLYLHCCKLDSKERYQIK